MIHPKGSRQGGYWPQVRRYTLGVVRGLVWQTENSSSRSLLPLLYLSLFPSVHTVPLYQLWGKGVDYAGARERLVEHQPPASLSGPHGMHANFAPKWCYSDPTMTRIEDVLREWE